eukprot:4774621-Pyramimonas_sp.AAC.1
MKRMRRRRHQRALRASRASCGAGNHSGDLGFHMCVHVRIQHYENMQIICTHGRNRAAKHSVECPRVPLNPQ